MDALRFSNARARVLSESGPDAGIGRLSEKSLHKILKYYIEPDDRFHEVPFLGSVADIKNASGIYEVQTRFAVGLRRKLEKLIASGCPVTLVVPLAARKTVAWIDKSTGEISSPRKSPKRESPFDFFAEFRDIAPLVGSAGFSVRLVFLDVAEYRYLDGWDKSRKHGSTRAERLPNSVIDVLELSSPASIAALLPFAPEAEFTARELAVHIGRTSRRTHSALRFLVASGAIAQCGKRGRAFIYMRNKV